MEPAQLIDQQIAELGDWRGKLYTRLRKIVRAADPELAEEWKWGTAVYARNGNVCAIGSFKDHVNLNFFKGASLPDPEHLLNHGLEAKTSRAIKFSQGDAVNEKAITDLVRAAVAANQGKK